MSEVPGATARDVAVLPPLPPGIERIAEQPAGRDVPYWHNARWAERHPWLEQGTTARGEAEPFDLGLAGTSPVGATLRRWRRLRAATGFETVVHARQVHGAAILRHAPGLPGILLAEHADGHATDAPQLLLTVSVADCVPISVIAAEQRVIALLHAGWRGTAAGMLEAGVELLARTWALDPASLEIHFGPAICGPCYEVGVEVPRELGLGDAATHVDLRAELALRALRLGVTAAAVTVSAHCTRCGAGAFFSHRAGDAGRQLAVLGIRDRRRG